MQPHTSACAYIIKKKRIHFLSGCRLLKSLYSFFSLIFVNCHDFFGEYTNCISPRVVPQQKSHLLNKWLYRYNYKRLIFIYSQTKQMLIAHMYHRDLQDFPGKQVNTYNFKRSILTNSTVNYQYFTILEPD